jgi:anti-anti-sigma regulatory factor
VDSAGVRALYTVADTATLRGAGVTVVVPRDSPVRRVLVLSGVERVLALVEPGAAAV